jgi:hypothetical protein
MTRTLTAGWIVATVLLAGVVAAEDVIVEVRTHGAAAPSETTLSLYSAHQSRPDAPALARPADTGGETRLSVPRGDWALEVRAPNFWHERQYFNVSGDATRVRADLWPAGQLTGEATAASGATPPGEITVWLETSSAGSAGRHSFRVLCPVEKGRFGCDVPAGSFDVQVRLAGHVPLFRSHIQVEPGRPRDLGKLVFEAGASLIGRIEIERHLKIELQQVMVEATPSSREGAPGPGGRYSAHVTANGSFHIDGLPPREYVVVARVQQLQSHPVAVTVIPNAIAELKRPLQVEEPQRITINLTPPRDPDGKVWHVELSRITGRGRNDVLTADSATDDGRWVSQPLGSGEYILTIGPAAGGSWWNEKIGIDGAAVGRSVELSARHVNGTVRLGDKPLAAQLSFQSQSIAVSLTADGEGRFEGYLPRKEAGDLWQVIISSDRPRVRRRLRDVAVPAADEATVDLVVPLNVVTGDVVDSQGKRVTAASVQLRHTTDRDEQTVQFPVDGDGAFAAYALAPGKYTAQAIAFLQQSDPSEFEISDGNSDAGPLHLVLTDERKIHGRVTSAFGPVSGAAVMLFPSGMSNFGVFREMTDGNGEFDATIAAAAREMDVFVEAPGLAFKAVHTRVQAGMLNLALDAATGQLVVPAPTTAMRPYLLHAGAFVPGQLLLNDWDAQIQGDHLQLGSMEPGSYSVCMLRDAEVAAFRAGAIDARQRCVSGFLPPFGTADLHGR